MNSKVTKSLVVVAVGTIAGLGYKTYANRQVTEDENTSLVVEPSTV